jgi:hypothetical protein
MQSVRVVCFQQLSVPCVLRVQYIAQQGAGNMAGEEGVHKGAYVEGSAPLCCHGCLLQATVPTLCPWL